MIYLKYYYNYDKLNNSYNFINFIIFVIMVKNYITLIFKTCKYFFYRTASRMWWNTIIICSMRRSISTKLAIMICVHANFICFRWNRLLQEHKEIASKIGHWLNNKYLIFIIDYDLWVWCSSAILSSGVCSGWFLTMAGEFSELKKLFDYSFVAIVTKFCINSWKSAIMIIMVIHTWFKQDESYHINRPGLNRHQCFYGCQQRQRCLYERGVQEVWWMGKSSLLQQGQVYRRCPERHRWQM